jgi:hypothetical protein
VVQVMAAEAREAAKLENQIAALQARLQAEQEARRQVSYTHSGYSGYSGCRSCSGSYPAR